MSAKAWAKIDGSTRVNVALPSPVDLVFPVIFWSPRTTAFRFDVRIETKFGTLSSISETPHLIHKVLSCGVGVPDGTHPDNPNIAVQP